MNVRSPYVAVWVRGTVNETVDSDRSGHVNLYTHSRPLRRLVLVMTRAHVFAEAAFCFEVESWAGHEQRIAVINSLCYESMDKCFLLYRERGIDEFCQYLSGGNIQFDIWNSRIGSYLDFDRK